VGRDRGHVLPAYNGHQLALPRWYGYFTTWTAASSYLPLRMLNLQSAEKILEAAVALGV